MKRENQELYFEPHEDKKFLRAISLMSKLQKFENHESESLIQHEKAHINMFEKLNQKNKIKGYLIQNTENGFRTAVGWNLSDLTPEESFKIALAPKNPSYADLCIAMNENELSQKMKIFHKIMGGSITDFRDSLLREAGVTL